MAKLGSFGELVTSNVSFRKFLIYGPTLLLCDRDWGTICLRRKCILWQWKDELVSYSVSACCVSNQIQTMLSRYWGRDEGSNIVRQNHSLHAITTPPAAASIVLWSLYQIETLLVPMRHNKNHHLLHETAFFSHLSFTQFLLKICTLPLGLKLCILFHSHMQVTLKLENFNAQKCLFKFILRYFWPVC